MAQLGLIGGGHVHHAGNGAEIGVVIIAGMGRSIGADIAGPVDGEAHRQALNGDVVDHLVISALQEGRIDGTEGLHALAGHARRKGHGMLLGNADIVDAAGKDLCELVEAGARGHGGGYGHHARISLGLLDQ